MKKTLPTHPHPLILSVVLLSLLAVGAPASEHGEGWIDLFNGKNLDGWTKRGGVGAYAIEDNVIVGTSAPNTPNTFLCTDKEYGDFVLEYEFKVHPELNSGVQIRSKSYPAYMNNRVHGYQVEIDPKDRAWTAGIYDEARRKWLNTLEDNEPARKAFKQNEWNKMRVVAIGDSIKTWLNGVPASDLKDALTPRGFIALQVHGVGDRTDPLQVRWRNLRLKDLEEAAWISIFDGKSLEGWEVIGDEKAFSVDKKGSLVAGGGQMSHIFYTGPLSDHQFKNFEFEAVVRANAGSNSGVFFHTEPREKRLLKGYEVQINNTHKDKKRTGSLFAIVDLEETPIKDDQLFVLNIRVYGKRIVVKVDGVTKIDYTEPENPERPKGREDRLLSSGQIALQGHDPDSIVYFKNIRIKPLPGFDAY